MALSKKWRVWELMDDQEKPFTLDAIHRRMSISSSYIYQCVDSNPNTYMYAFRPRGAHFFRLYFPHGWTTEQVQAHLDASTDSGKSKATIYVTGGGQ